MLLYYDADGNLRKKSSAEGVHEYFGGIEYLDGNLLQVMHVGGRFVADADDDATTTEDLRVEFSLTDHLGNVRVSFSDLNNNGVIEIEDDLATAENENEILQENHYYPFGLNQNGTWVPTVSPENKYQFNGIEYVDEGGLNINMAFYRTYDPAVGRWWQVDPMAESFYSLSPYNGMGNNPISFNDPDGDSPILVGALIYSAFFTDRGYEIQKRISPVAVKFSIELGSDGSSVGVETSIGIPKLSPFSYRWHFGATFRTDSYDGGVSGYESTNGKEVSYLSGFFSLSSTQYHSRSSDGQNTSQILGGIMIGGPNANAKYQNDWYPSWVNKLAIGMKFGDNGDRWRTAAVQINAGLFSAGFNLFTGDPGFLDGDREAVDGTGRHAGKKVYDSGTSNKYRSGIAYFGLGPLKFGGNTEGIRHEIQNIKVHNPLGVPHFQYLYGRSKFYWSIGTGHGSSLW